MTLVSIVGDFYSSVLPIFYEFKDSIKRHIILYDDYKNDVVYAKKIINGTTKFIQKEQLDIRTFTIKMDEDSLSGIQSVIEIIKEHTQEYDRLYINITDGLANIAVLLSQAFLEKGAKIITYDRYDNEYNQLSHHKMQKCKMKSSIPIRTHFMLKDIELLSYQKRDFAHENEDTINLFFEKYEADRKLYNASKGEVNPLSHKQTGFLYEDYIYNLIKRLSYDDILLGAKIRDKREDGIYLENEYDILIMKENHLHMIECKYLKVLDATALLYKLDSVRESLDEDANIIIVTNFDTYNEVANLPNKLITQTYKRAFAKRVYLRGSPVNKIDTFIQEVDTIFSLKTKNLQTSRESYRSIKIPIRIQMKKEINSFLSKKFNLNVDFFDKELLLNLFHYKSYKKTNSETKKAMSEELIDRFIHLINTMLTSKSEYISMEDLYQYYQTNFKGNE